MLLKIYIFHSIKQIVLTSRYLNQVFSILNIIKTSILTEMQNQRTKNGQFQREKLSTRLLSLATIQKMEKDTHKDHIQEEEKRKYKKKQRPLTQEQIEVFRQAFEIFDSNHSGNIDQEELGSLLNALGFDYTALQVKKIFEEVDEDGSGVIEINEFVHFMSKQILDTQNIRKQINKVFRHFDDDNSGYLDFKKIKAMMSECFFNLDDESIMNMINTADTDGDGRVSQYEFLRIMKKVKLI